MPHYGSPPRVDDRRILSGIIHVLRCGCRWYDCPPDHGPCTTVYNRFNRWSRRGIWPRIYAAITGDERTPGQLLADSTHVKAHRSAAGAENYGLIFTAKGVASLLVLLGNVVAEYSGGWHTEFWLSGVMDVATAFIILFVMKPMRIRATSGA